MGSLSCFSFSFTIKIKVSIIYWKCNFKNVRRNPKLWWSFPFNVDCLLSSIMNKTFTVLVHKTAGVLLETGTAYPLSVIEFTLSFCFGGVCVGHYFSFLCCIVFLFCFVCLCSVACIQCCLRLFAPLVVSTVYLPQKKERNKQKLFINV